MSSSSSTSREHLERILGNESNDSILESYGIISKDKLVSETLRPKQCPNCNEPNKPDSRFCFKCRMVLSYDSYNETLDIQKQKEDKLAIMEEQFKSMDAKGSVSITKYGSISQKCSSKAII